MNQIDVVWDQEAQVWVAIGVPGLATEAESLVALQAKLDVMIPELLGKSGAELPPLNENTRLSVHCKTHPDAPHGFDRNASHTEGRDVCECESWKPDDQLPATSTEHGQDELDGHNRTVGQYR